MTPELSRLVPIERITSQGLAVTVDATPEECAALAVRFRVPAIAAISCDWSLAPPLRGVVRATGSLRALVTQTCVVTLDEFETSVVEAFSLRFVPDGTEDPTVDPDAEDEVPYQGDRLDIGETTAEQLALALDPYPRRPGLPEGDLAPGAAEPSHPFAGLRGRVAPH